MLKHCLVYILFRFIIFFCLIPHIPSYNTDNVSSLNPVLTAIKRINKKSDKPSTVFHHAKRPSSSWTETFFFSLKQFWMRFI